MPSKEEIENAYWKDYIQKQKVKELESEKQKLIEKLEEDIKSNNKSMTDVLNYTNMVKATRVSYAQEILNFISK